MKVIIAKNKEHNGIEITFEKIPDVKIRESLKQNGFRWHSQKRVWYAKENAARLEFCKRFEQKEQKDEKSEVMEMLERIAMIEKDRKQRFERRRLAHEVF